MIKKYGSIYQRNLRATARGEYYRWLFYRFRHARLLEMADADPGPISLKKIFVPLRADLEDMDEEKMTGPDKVDEEEIPGEALWDLLLQNRFMAVSGRPGSGKTTLVHAIVLEITDRPYTKLYEKLSAKQGIAPIPLILRNYPDIENLETLDDLLDRWWEEAEIQAKADKLPLDVDKLKVTFDPEKENFPAILLFDGVDEVGGPEIRNHVFKMAMDAAERGFRVLITGRPGGFANLDPGIAAKLPLYYLQSFVWKQIDRFIRDWYNLFDDWKRKKDAGIRNFLGALRETKRDYLLTLARRPIFLTLMALVHCSRNEMPDGRPALYKAIIDLYLVRQEQHRRLSQNVEGKPMPHWPEQEKRMALGYIAWIGQKEGEKLKEKQRQVVWKREELIEIIRGQLFTRKYGRFTVLKPDDAGDLLDYFLHPTGLLTDPEHGHIQFAHLSFQEYMCAEFLHTRARVGNFRDYLKTELFSRLGKPGWLEVGMLLMAIHSEQTHNEGHFELLGMLDPCDANQAKLMIQALTGRELSFTGDERRAWLPVMIGCALTHPDTNIAGYLSRLSQELHQAGLDIVQRLFEIGDPGSQWDMLVETAKETPGIDAPDDHPFFHELRDRWVEPEKDESWLFDFGKAEARSYALLNLVDDSGWARNRNAGDEVEAAVLAPVSPLSTILAKWIERECQLGEKSSILWERDEDDLPTPTDTSVILDILTPDRGVLWNTLLARVPLDGWLLQGECYEDYEFFFAHSQPCILLSLYPEAELPLVARLAIGFYHAGSRSLSLARSPSLISKLKKIKKLAGKHNFDDKLLNAFFFSLECFMYRHAAMDWFTEQAESPDLMTRRGMHPGEPLPKDLDLFDDRGMPFPAQKRDNWVRLRRWIDDDDAVLEFFFPEGLPEKWEKHLRSEMEILKKQPWSPQAALDAILEDWPESEPERPYTLEYAEEMLSEACDEFLEAAERERKQQD